MHAAILAHAAVLTAMFPPQGLVQPDPFIGSGIHYAMTLCQRRNERFFTENSAGLMIASF
jgi:hypothetical protein